MAFAITASTYDLNFFFITVRLCNFIFVCVCAVWGGQKRVSDPQDLVLMEFVSNSQYGDLNFGPQDRAASTLLTTKPSVSLKLQKCSCYIQEDRVKCSLFCFINFLFSTLNLIILWSMLCPRLSFVISCCFEGGWCTNLWQHCKQQIIR